MKWFALSVSAVIALGLYLVVGRYQAPRDPGNRPEPPESANAAGSEARDSSSDGRWLRELSSAVRQSTIKGLVDKGQLANQLQTAGLRELELPDVPPPPITDEEREHLRKVAKVQDIYWSKGQEVLEAMLAEQSKDQRWETDVARSARSMLESSRFEGTDLKSVQCGSTLCKIEFHHRDAGSRQRFDSSGGLDNPSWLGHDFGVVKKLGSGEDSSVETLMYFAKDNQPYEVMLDRLVQLVDGTTPG